MKTVLICHHDDDMNKVGLARWLASFTDLVGVVVIQEGRTQKTNRFKREVKRLGRVRFADVVAYRLYHRVVWQGRDAAYERSTLDRIARTYPELPRDLPVHTTETPNSADTREFLEKVRPDMVIARCKVLLKPEIFEIPPVGTFVMHPGICPEYRNAHGCFWALANRDVDKVGMTLLKIDRGIDTGPVYGFFTYDYDERRESHIIIQHRVVFDNLDAIRDKLLEIEKGTAETIDTRGRKSGNWGQPWMTRYIAWKNAARQRDKNGPGIAPLS